MFKFFSREKKTAEPVETKSNVPFHAFYNLITGSPEYSHVSAWQALRYYKTVAPVATCIDKITDEFKALQPSLYNKKKQNFDPDHPIIQFLSHPNAAVSSTDFLKSVSNYYEITGKAYLMAIGNPNRPPLEIYSVPPQHVTPQMGTDGFVSYFEVNTPNSDKKGRFVRKEVNKRFRYFDEMDRELWQIKDFNPDGCGSNGDGFSRLNPIYYEIEQFLHGSDHNLSLLKNGGRLTGALVTDQVLSDEAFERLQEEITKYTGMGNAGKFGLFEGGVKFQEMGKSLRDMDFATLMAAKKEDISSRLNVPLPLVSSTRQTLNNMETSMVMLYFNAVLPLANKLFEEITLFIGPRFKLTADEVISIDLATIPALQSWRIENLKRRKEIGVESTNEYRSLLGREPAANGDAILAPATLAPIGQDIQTEDNRDESVRKYFRDCCAMEKDIKGNPMYTDAEIKQMEIEQFGEK